MESDDPPQQHETQKSKFQSTLSVWRVTWTKHVTVWAELFQSTLSVWRVTLTNRGIQYQINNFNPHSLYGE